MEKQEIVSDLLAVRAGLSLISENADIIQQTKMKKKQLSSDANDKLRSYNIAKDELPLVQKEKNELIARRRQIESDYKETKSLLTGKKKFNEEAIKEEAKNESLSEFFPDFSLDFSKIVSNGILWGLTFVVMLTIVNFVGYVVTDGESWGWESFFEEAQLTVFNSIVYPAILCVYPLILWIRFLCVRPKLIDQYVTQQRRKYNSSVREIEYVETQLLNNLNSVNKKISDLENQESQLIRTQANYIGGITNYTMAARQETALCESLIDHCVKENVRIRDFLAENYNNVITPSDWANIDLIVYYLNTGRADTIKEALQLVDEQRRNDAIVSAINSASREISGTIQRNFNALSGMLSSHFSRINMQIEDMSFRMDKLGNEMKNMSSVLGSQISKLTEVNRLQSAFMVKAAKSTAELVDDMNRSVTVNVAIRNV